MLQPKLLIYLLKVLNENHIEYMVTGSIVSSLQGEPRVTHDVDIVVNIPSTSISPLLKAFPAPRYYLSEFSIKDAIEHKSMFNLLDTNEGDKFDFWILTDSPFDKSRFDRRYDADVFGLQMKVSRPEDTILAKLRWANLSGGSKKQFGDALSVYEVQYAELDIKYIEEWVIKLSVEDIWKNLIEESNPIR
ncbi:MAG: hypothetical protein ABI723_12245 [Bacteroidia bacterium]